ncbi:alpha/beta-hydrolase [Cutaneotrichosporon oleaginosum]|uniref:Alpha/beta-hydrolase n=1 Tax=Cutaneotrichosporon oleaginosum TaxID=879819 RepID=A0A0J0XHH2_9TREE|nr:alpha/beta-hydrolase [Cutaneotrichosporon oleaginosum]KLT40457.1 alpha/beta-hydrolase [Cutaneotrichosporon oleaginosum]TXT15350.1 hypothetical protein COLE_01543 [Cutaneotrichosporon oleaginosum]
MAALPWPLPREPTPLVRGLVQLVTLPPTLVGVLLSLLYNTADYALRRPSYPFKRHIILGALRFFQNASSALRFVMPRDAGAAAIPKAAAARGKTEYGVRIVPPIPDALRLPSTRLTAGMAGVRAVPVPLFGVAPRGDAPFRPAAHGELCFLHLVGGGYQVGHPLRFPLSTEYVARTGVRLFAPNYRKCLDDASGFPAPLLDMLAGLQFVLEDLGFAPENVILIGESAGAHGALMLARYMDDLRAAGVSRWGLPGGIFASAPWTNVLCTYPSIDSNYATDWLAPIRRVIAPAFARHCAGFLTHPLLSPALSSVEDGHYARLAEAGVRVHVDCGTDEMLYDDGVALVRAMRAQGLEPQFREVPHGVHCEFAFATLMPGIYPGAGFSWPLLLGDLDDMVAQLRAR